MVRYSDELIEEIRISNDIVDVVSEYVKLEKRGKNYFGLCPFHREKTPSFSVEPIKQFFYCYGCGKGGNVFQFISQVEKLEYIESVRLLADRAKIQLPEEEDREQAEKARQRQEVMKVNLAAARYFYENLFSEKGEKARKYLKDRGISENTVKKFGLGYSSEEWDNLYRHLAGKGFDTRAVLDSKLAVTGKNGKAYDNFRGRVMFPIFDVRGNVIGFGGRVMDGSQPKYMNSPETIVYNKGRNLYALNYAKNSGDKILVVVEGYMDAISLHQNGIVNAVASLGTALTENQGRLLKKYAEEIVISFDADTAGQSATLRGLDLLGDIGCHVKVLTVPDGKDPDEYVRKNGPEGFRKLIEGASPLVEYKVRNFKSEHNIETIDGKIAFLNKVAALLARIENSVEREMYIKRFSGEYEISEESLYSEVMKKLRPRTVEIKRPIESAAVSKQSDVAGGDLDKKIIHDERFILSLLCSDINIYKSMKQIISEKLFSDGENARIAGILLERLEKNRDTAPAELLDMVSGEYAGEFARILKEECHCDDNKRAILGKIRDIEIYKTEKRQRQIMELLKDESTLPEGDVEKLKLEFKELALKIKKIKSN